MSQDLETIRLQNEIERLDREWAIEREKYRIEGNRGSSSLPTSGTAVMAVIGGIVAVLFLLFWISIAASMFGGIRFGEPAGFPGSSSPFGGIGLCFPLFGVGALILVVIGVVTNVSKASGYSQAEHEYLRKREALMRNLQRR